MTKADINGRQLCFFAAFVLPVAKLLTLPSVLAESAKNDLLFPALAQFILQAGVIALLLFTASRTDQSIYSLIENKLGVVAAKAVYGLYAAYFIFASLLPLLELERFVYVAFFDTAPVAFSLTPFFLLSAFVCTRNLKGFARTNDLAAPLFLVAFLGLIGMALSDTDLSALLPVGGGTFKGSLRAFGDSVPQFIDAALFFPLLGAYRYQKGDGKKILLSYGAGALFVLFFLAVFYGIFGPIALRQRFAFVKIAQYFSALAVVGRIDLLLTYLLTVVLLFYTCLPLLLSTRCTARVLGTKKTVWIALILNFGLFLFTFFCTEHYNLIYRAVGHTLKWVFPLFTLLLPALTPLLTLRKRGEAR